MLHAAATLAGHGLRRMSKRLRSRSRSRRVVRRRFVSRTTTRTKSKKHVAFSAPMEGGFTRCVDKRVRRRRISRSFRKFSRKVQSIINRNEPVRKFVNDFTGYFPIGGLEQLATASRLPIVAQVGWLQLGLDVVNYQANQAYNNTTSTPNYSVTVGTFDEYATVGNGYSLYCPLLANGVTLATNPQQLGNTNVPSNGAGLSLWDYFQSVGSSLILNNVNTENSYALWMGPRYMHVELKNTSRIFKYHVVIYTVGCKQSQKFRPQNNQDPYTSTNGMYYGSPLEAYARGMGRCGLNTTQFLTTRSYGLTDSKDFNENYYIKKKCSAYIPAGGSLTKALSHKKGRFIDAEHLTDFGIDRGTEYFVMKAYPEHEFGAQSATGTSGITNFPGIPVNQVAGNTATGSWPTNSTLTNVSGTGKGNDLTFALSYRYAFRPAMKSIIENQYYIINNMPAIDVLATGTTGVVPTAGAGPGQFY